MKSNLLIGLLLGLVAAVAFASATTGPFLIRLILVVVTSLPIALAGLGWGWTTAAIAGTFGVGIVALAAGPLAASVFGLTQVAPVVALTYLALLSRPLALPPAYAKGEDTPPLEFYPPGRIVVWAAVMAGALPILLVVVSGADLEAVRKAMGEVVQEAIRASMPETPEGKALTEDDLAIVTEVALAVLPAATAISWMGSLLLNIWLAGRITLASSQLARPWPDLAAMEFPRGTALALGIALLGTSLTGYPGIAAASFAGPFFLAYVLIGLAVAHYTTRGRPWRPFALWSLYAALLLFNAWIALIVAIVGLAEGVFHVRARYAPRSHDGT